MSAWGVDSYLISFQLTPEDYCALIERINGSFHDKHGFVLVSGPETIGKTTSYVYWSKSLAEGREKAPEQIEATLRAIKRRATPRTRPRLRGK
jgi:hypothetical protein